MARILIVGTAALDIINTVEAYPAEDTRHRAITRRITLGGNAANVAVVLRQLGHQCSLGAVLADDAGGENVRVELHRRELDLDRCRIEAGGAIPTSYITVSRRTGTRTIVHFRDLPEFGFDDFAGIDLGAFAWVHFEGRNVAETRRMIARIRQRSPAMPVSVEIGRPRPDGEERLFDWADVLFFSHAYATARGFENPRGFLSAMAENAPGVQRICSWGKIGVYGLSREGRECFSPAYPPKKVVDTVGASSTFHAGAIDALLQRPDLDAALQAGSRLAGQKCAQVGLDGLFSP